MTARLSPSVKARDALRLAEALLTALPPTLRPEVARTSHFIAMEHALPDRSPTP